MNNLDEYKKLISMFDIYFENKSAGNSLQGKTFVITGTLSRPRPAIKSIIEENGGKVLSAVSSKLNYLVAGEDCGSKLEAAKKLGITIIDEDSLNLMIENGRL